MGAGGSKKVKEDLDEAKARQARQAREQASSQVMDFSESFNDERDIDFAASTSVPDDDRAQARTSLVVGHSHWTGNDDMDLSITELDDQAKNSSASSSPSSPTKGSKRSDAKSSGRGHDEAKGVAIDLKKPATPANPRLVVVPEEMFVLEDVSSPPAPSKSRKVYKQDRRHEQGQVQKAREHKSEKMQMQMQEQEQEQDFERSEDLVQPPPRSRGSSGGGGGLGGGRKLSSGKSSRGSSGSGDRDRDTDRDKELPELVRTTSQESRQHQHQHAAIRAAAVTATQAILARSAELRLSPRPSSSSGGSSTGDQKQLWRRDAPASDGSSSRRSSINIASEHSSQQHDLHETPPSKTSLRHQGDEEHTSFTPPLRITTPPRLEMEAAIDLGKGSRSGSSSGRGSSRRDRAADTSSGQHTPPPPLTPPAAGLPSQSPPSAGSGRRSAKSPLAASRLVVPPSPTYQPKKHEHRLHQLQLQNLSLMNDEAGLHLQQKHQHQLLHLRSSLSNASIEFEDPDGDEEDSVDFSVDKHSDLMSFENAAMLNLQRQRTLSSMHNAKLEMEVESLMKQLAQMDELEEAEEMELHQMARLASNVVGRSGEKSKRDDHVHHHQHHHHEQQQHPHHGHEHQHQHQHHDLEHHENQLRHHVQRDAHPTENLPARLTQQQQQQHQQHQQQQSPQPVPTHQHSAAHKAKTMSVSPVEVELNSGGGGGRKPSYGRIESSASLPHGAEKHELVRGGAPAHVHHHVHESAQLRDDARRGSNSEKVTRTKAPPVPDAVVAVRARSEAKEEQSALEEKRRQRRAAAREEYLREQERISAAALTREAASKARQEEKQHEAAVCTPPRSAGSDGKQILANDKRISDDLPFSPSNHKENRRHPGMHGSEDHRVVGGEGAGEVATGSGGSRTTAQQRQSRLGRLAHLNKANLDAEQSRAVAEEKPRAAARDREFSQYEGSKASLERLHAGTGRGTPPAESKQAVAHIDFDIEESPRVLEGSGADLVSGHASHAQSKTGGKARRELKELSGDAKDDRSALAVSPIRRHRVTAQKEVDASLLKMREALADMAHMQVGVEKERARGGGGGDGLGFVSGPDSSRSHHHGHAGEPTALANEHAPKKTSQSRSVLKNLNKRHSCLTAAVSNASLDNAILDGSTDDLELEQSMDQSVEEDQIRGYVPSIPEDKPKSLRSDEERDFKGVAALKRKGRGKGSKKLQGLKAPLPRDVEHPAVPPNGTKKDPWSETMDMRHMEVELLLRRPMRSDDDIDFTLASAEAGLIFMDELNRVAQSLNILRGTLSRWLLPFDNNTAISDQSSTVNSVVDSMPDSIRGKLTEKQVHYLVSGLNSVRQLIRVKIADDNDLEQARAALRTAADFLRRLQKEAETLGKGTTAYTLLQARSF